MLQICRRKGSVYSCKRPGNLLRSPLYHKHWLSLFFLYVYAYIWHVFFCYFLLSLGGYSCVKASLHWGPTIYKTPCLICYFSQRQAGKNDTKLEDPTSEESRHDWNWKEKWGLHICKSCMEGILMTVFAFVNYDFSCIIRVCIPRLTFFASEVRKLGLDFF